MRVDVGGKVMDCVKVFQNETLGIICPLAGNSYLNAHESGYPEWCSYIQLTNVYHCCMSLRA